MSVKSDQKTHSIDPQLPAAIGGASIEGKGEKVKMKKWAAWFFGLLIVGCGAALPPPTNLAVLIALSAPTATLTAEFESTKKAAKNSKKGTAKWQPKKQYLSTVRRNDIGDHSCPFGRMSA